MKIVKTTLDIKMKSEKQVSLGVWQGAKIRSALNFAVARRFCDNLEFGKCDTCNIGTCMNKYLFNFKSDKRARMESQPIIVDCDFNDSEVISDTFNIQIHLFYPATEYLDDMLDILKQGVYLGNPMVKFIAEDIQQSDTEIDLDVLKSDAQDMTNTTLDITFETPFITNGKSGVTSQQIIRSCTTRITSMVNTVGVNYTVTYEGANNAASQIELVKCNFSTKHYGKMSSRKSKYSTIHGVVGTMRLHGDFSKIYNYLNIASELNIGKECTMGFGKFTVKVVEQ